MSENFAELLQQSLTQTDLRTGAVTKATVVKILPEMVIVNAGLKSEPVFLWRNLKMKMAN